MTFSSYILAYASNLINFSRRGCVCSSHLGFRNRSEEKKAKFNVVCALTRIRLQSKEMFWDGCLPMWLRNYLLDCFSKYVVTNFVVFLVSRNGSSRSVSAIENKPTGGINSSSTDDYFNEEDDYDYDDEAEQTAPKMDSKLLIHSTTSTTSTTGSSVDSSKKYFCLSVSTFATRKPEFLDSPLCTVCSTNFPVTVQITWKIKIML